MSINPVQYALECQTLDIALTLAPNYSMLNVASVNQLAQHVLHKDNQQPDNPYYSAADVEQLQIKFCLYTLYVLCTRDIQQPHTPALNATLLQEFTSNICREYSALTPDCEQVLQDLHTSSVADMLPRIVALIDTIRTQLKLIHPQLNISDNDTQTDDSSTVVSNEKLSTRTHATRSSTRSAKVH